jgi:hypothetical protein
MASRAVTWRRGARLLRKRALFDLASDQLENEEATHPNLTPEDFDWLRKIRAASDAKRDPPPVPMEIAGKLRTFGFVTPNGLSGLAITDRGRGALLEQDMRDAEDR